MQNLLDHELARSYDREHRRHAAHVNRAARLAAARRWQRRAEAASRQARLALAAASR